MCFETSLFAAEGRTIHDVAQDNIVIQVFENQKMHLVRWTSCQSLYQQSCWGARINRFILLSGSYDGRDVRLCVAACCVFIHLVTIFDSVDQDLLLKLHKCKD